MTESTRISVSASRYQKDRIAAYAVKHGATTSAALLALAMRQLRAEEAAEAARATDRSQVTAERSSLAARAAREPKFVPGFGPVPGSASSR